MYMYIYSYTYVTYIALGDSLPGKLLVCICAKRPSLHTYIYIYVCIYICIHVYISHGVGGEGQQHSGLAESS